MQNQPAGAKPINSRPTGTVTFLFTDIEGSTKRWEAYPQQMRAALQRHDTILRSAIERHSGHVFKTMGDAFCAAFSSPNDAIQATLDAQHALHREPWPQGIGSVAVRAALHTGTPEEWDGDYFGPPVNRVARLLSAGHGGQTLLSLATQELVRDDLPAGVELLDMGERRLKDLFRPEHVFQLLAQDLPSNFPSLKTLDARPNNLPTQPNPLVGREKEAREAAGILRKPGTRMLTLTGPGGTGKTRLGLQMAADMVDEFDDGAMFVDLSALLESALVVPTIARVLGVQEQGATPLVDTLKEYLKEKQMLLVLDNFEQVLEAGKQIASLLQSASRLKVLATSRIPLRLQAEREYAVAPLSLPDTRQGHLPSLEQLTQYGAVRLFIERAQAVKADFEVTNDNAPSVAEICVRLDGLPLAIELAAARVKMLPPQAMLSRLQNRLKMLTGGAKDLTARQQTLRGAIDWSYDLLGEGHKQLFQRMAVFQGGRTLEGLEAVCNSEELQVYGQLQVEVFDGVETLLSSSLIQQREDVDGESRFWMLETIHEYAKEKLEESGELDALEREHALFFMRLAEQAEPHLTGKKQVEWMGRVEEEHDNLRAALRWAMKGGSDSANANNAKNDERVEAGLRIGGALYRFWLVRGYWGEGRDALEGLLTRARGVVGCSSGVMAKALNLAGTLFYMQGDYTTARSLYEESLALNREIGDNSGIALSLGGLGIVAQMQGDNATARPLLEEGLALRRELGDKGGIANSLGGLGIVAQMQGDYFTARSLYEESLALNREIGDKNGIAGCLGNIGNLEYSMGEYGSALSHYKESLLAFLEMGDKHNIAWCLGGVGGARAQIGQRRQTGEVEKEVEEVERGARLLGAAEALLKEIGSVLEPVDRIPYDGGVSSARSVLGEVRFERLRHEGQAMSMEQAIEYALEER